MKAESPSNSLNMYTARLLAQETQENSEVMFAFYYALLERRANGQLCTPVPLLQKIILESTGIDLGSRITKENETQAFPVLSFHEKNVPVVPVIRIETGKTQSYIFQRDFLILQKIVDKLCAHKVENAAETDMLEGLNQAQNKALKSALQKRITIITGGPGTGKTFLISKIAEQCHARGMQIQLAAPTGKAVRRISEISERPGLEAKTIHRLLQQKTDGTFRKNIFNTIEADMLVLDECSMLTFTLFERVLDALPERAALVLVGDADQLPPVDGPGVFAALSVILPQTGFEAQVLTEAVRFSPRFQQISSAIISRGGALPEITETPNIQNIEDVYESGSNDIIFFPMPETSLRFQCVQFIRNCIYGNIQSYLEKLNLRETSVIHLQAKFNEDSGCAAQIAKLLSQAVILTPYSVSEFLGAGAISEFVNSSLYGQAQAGEENQVEVFPVMVNQNNYKIGLFNGDTGFCLRDMHHQRFWFFDQEMKKWRHYPEITQHDCVISWAITIHKSQGSEYNRVMVLVPENANKVLSANALYTAITRAKNAAFICGNKQTLSEISSADRYF